MHYEALWIFERSQTLTNKQIKKGVAYLYLHR